MRLSSPKEEGVFQASKWLSHRLLIDKEEMEHLLEVLSPFSIYNVSELVSLENSQLSRENFLRGYNEYIRGLKGEDELNEAPLKPLFSSVFSATPDIFYAMPVKGEFIIKPTQPVIQLSLHHFIFSPEQMKFHSMVHSEESVSWGIQFSYPQLYSNSIKGDVIEIYKDSTYLNTELFKLLAKWVRKETQPAAFLYEERKIHATFRIGKKALKWAGMHPHLQNSALKVVGEK